MSFGKQQPNSLVPESLTEMVFEVSEKEPDRFSPQSNTTPCFNSVTPSQSPDKLPLFKFSWQDSPPEQKIPVSIANLDDSFSEFSKKLNIIEKQREYLYEEERRSCVLVPVKVQQGSVLFLTDRFDCLTLPARIGCFKNGEAVIMAIERVADKFYGEEGIQKELANEFEDDQNQQM